MRQIIEQLVVTVTRDYKNILLNWEYISQRNYIGMNGTWRAIKMPRAGPIVQNALGWPMVWYKPSYQSKIEMPRTLIYLLTLKTEVRKMDCSF